jgi:hypothetical protein
MHVYGIKQQEFKLMYDTVEKSLSTALRNHEYEIVEGIGKVLSMARNAMEKDGIPDGPTYVMWLPTHDGFAPEALPKWLQNST